MSIYFSNQTEFTKGKSRNTLWVQLDIKLAQLLMVENRMVEIGRNTLWVQLDIKRH